MIKQRRAYEVEGKIFMKKVEAVEYTKRLEEAHGIAVNLANAVKIVKKVKEDTECYEFGDGWTGYVGYLNDFLRYYGWVDTEKGIAEHAKNLASKDMKKEEEDG